MYGYLKIDSRRGPQNTRRPRALVEFFLGKNNGFFSQEKYRSWFGCDDARQISNQGCQIVRCLTRYFLFFFAFSCPYYGKLTFWQPWLICQSSDRVSGLRVFELMAVVVCGLRETLAEVDRLVTIISTDFSRNKGEAWKKKMLTPKLWKMSEKHFSAEKLPYRNFWFLKHRKIIFPYIFHVLDSCTESFKAHTQLSTLPR